MNIPPGPWDDAISRSDGSFAAPRDHPPASPGPRGYMGNGRVAHRRSPIQGQAEPGGQHRLLTGLTLRAELMSVPSPALRPLLERDGR